MRLFGGTVHECLNMSAEHLVCFAFFVLGVAAQHLRGLELAV